MVDKAKTERLMNKMLSHSKEERTPVGTDIFLPNLSGVTSDPRILDFLDLRYAGGGPGHTRLHRITNVLDHSSTATSGKMLKADANGLPVDATNTDAQVASAVTNSHAEVHTHALAAGATDVTATAAEVNKLAGTPAGLTATEIGYVDGVTSAIQTQIDGKSDTGHTHAQLHDRSHAMTGASDHTAGNWKVFYSNGTGAVTELALGADGEVLTSTGATGAPAFEAVVGGKPSPYVFSRGSDGNRTVSATTDDTTANKKYYNNLTIDAGFTLSANTPYIIRVAGTLTVNGTLKANVSPAGAASSAGVSGGGASGVGGAGGGTLIIYAETIAGNGTISCNGGNGGNGTNGGSPTGVASGTNGAAGTASIFEGANGTAGGAGDSGEVSTGASQTRNGGTAGAAEGALTDFFKYFVSFYSTDRPTSGSSGGSGGADNNSTA